MKSLKKRIQNILSKLGRKSGWKEKPEEPKATDKTVKREHTPKVTNRKPLRFYNRHFYTTVRGAAGAGVRDFYGKFYQIQGDGSLRRITPRRHEVNQSL